MRLKWKFLYDCLIKFTRPWIRISRPKIGTYMPSAFEYPIRLINLEFSSFMLIVAEFPHNNKSKNIILTAYACFCAIYYCNRKNSKKDEFLRGKSFMFTTLLFLWFLFVMQMNPNKIETTVSDTYSRLRNSRKQKLVQ